MTTATTPRATSTRLIDTDSHIIEPPDLWTSRVASKWGDLVPHVEFNERMGEDVWRIGDTSLSAVGMLAMVGWPEVFPHYPPRISDVPSAMWEPHDRLRLLDEAGIHAQVMYPNLVGGFFANRFMTLDPELSLECTRAYNDYITEFCSADPNRLLALTILPFWDVEESVREMERGAEAGHKGVLFAHSFEKVGLPNIPDERWHPILDAAQSLGQSINFHVGFSVASSGDGGDRGQAEQMIEEMRDTPRHAIADEAVMSYFSSAKALNLLLFHGVCHRYPTLNFVTVESGFGYVPFQLQAADWQWISDGLNVDHPDWLLPSEYYHRQIYSCMWFERPALEHLEQFQDNLMWETDYPHPVAQWPTPTSAAALPADEAVEYSFAGASDEIRDKILYRNAARLYHLD